jgi:hypothetical protein
VSEEWGSVPVTIRGKFPQSSVGGLYAAIGRQQPGLVRHVDDVAVSALGDAVADRAPVRGHDPRTSRRKSSR